MWGIRIREDRKFARERWVMNPWTESPREFPSFESAMAFAKLSFPKSEPNPRRLFKICKRSQRNA